jgi:UrcA family protein
MLSPLKSLALIAAVAAAGPALADTASRSVKITDLNLASVEGRATLDQRLVRAARQICGQGNSQDLSQIAASAKCYRASIASARADAEVRIAARTRGDTLIGSR